MNGEGKKRIGVFVCHCGVNIAGVVDVKRVAEEMADYSDVELSTNYVYMCSEPGQNTILEMAKENDLNAIVIAACSPKLHEETFRKAAELAGMNPYHVEIANIREQCSWVHSNDKEHATLKALETIKTMVEKLRLDQALNPIQCAVNRKTLILGGGISGMRAALDIADRGHRVTLVEKEAFLGGRLNQLSRTFLTLDDSPFLMATMLKRVMDHPKIEILNSCEIENLSGYVGNFTAKIRKTPRYVDWEKCDGCGQCIDVCPVAVDGAINGRDFQEKAVFLTPNREVARKAVIDRKTCIHFKKGCTACQDACPQRAFTFKQREVSLEREIGAVIVATGFDLYPKKEIPEYAGGKSPDVVSGLEFERLLVESEQTGKPVQRPSDGKVPKRIVFIQCAKSRDPELGMPYCSGICCKYTSKQVRQYHMTVPDGQSYVFYIDVRTGGKNAEEFYQDLLDNHRSLYLRGKVSKVFPEGDILRVWGVDTLTGQVLEIEADMVVMATAVTPQTDAKALSQRIKAPTDVHGFFQEIHPKLRPVESPTAGIFLAGSARGPLDIPESITHASAAASKVMSLFAQDVIEHEPIVAYVDEELCVGCGICVEACPYGARILDDRDKVARVIDVLCQGCGSCVAACPNGASQQYNFDAEQYMNMIEAAFT